MNKQELVNAIATNSGISKKNVEEVLKNFVTVVMDDVTLVLSKAHPEPHARCVTREPVR